MKKKKYTKYNTDVQFYKEIPVRLIVYTEEHFARLNAKRFTINHTSQNIWIPNSYLEPDGTIKLDADIDFIFKQAYLQKKLKYANIHINPFDWTT